MKSCCKSPLSDLAIVNCYNRLKRCCLCNANLVHRKYELILFHLGARKTKMKRYILTNVSLSGFSNTHKLKTAHLHAPGLKRTKNDDKNVFTIIMKTTSTVHRHYATIQDRMEDCRHLWGRIVR